MPEEAHRSRPPWCLRLYVAGATARSNRAIRVMKQICEEHLGNRCDFEVVDVYQHPELARTDHIIAVPTLVRSKPLPVRRMIGDLSDREKVMRLLELD
jgi:circadian clock protein KaiB